jgi:hypothetical protein
MGWPRSSLRIGLGGRAGAGRRTVAHALSGAGLSVSTCGDADVDVYVFVETLNGDDRAALASAVRPTVAVLNKADLAGFGGDGPIAVTARRCRDLQRATAIPTRPLSALLAVAATDPAVLDPAMIDTLRTLVTSPSCVSDGARRRMAKELDLLGTAFAVSAVRSGAGRDGVAALLRTVSGLDEVCAEVERAAAVVHYHRLTDMLEGQRTGDDVVFARMAAAAAVLSAAGAADVDCVTRSDHLRRAIRWQRYARGPVSPMHRTCAMEVARGALRHWARAEPGAPG